MQSDSYNTLISAEVLSKELCGSTETSDWIIVDCRFSLLQPDSGYAEYQNGHIPRAQYAHLDDDLSSPQTEVSGRHPLPEKSDWISRLESWGIGPDSQVVVYDHGSGAVASRLWWMLRWSGHMSVAVLDGGFKGWQEDGLPVTTETCRAKGSRFSAGVSFDRGLWVSTDQLENELAGITLLDARSAMRFDGVTEPIDPVAGHVPGAINMPLEGNLDENEKFLPAHQLRERFINMAGIIDVEKELSNIVHMCGSGVTACHNMLAMEVAGLTGSRLYVGSWSEWIRDPNRKVVHSRS